MSEGYNGWTNYETWNCKLWIDNDEANQSYWAERAQDVYNDAEADETFTREERAALELSGMLESAHDESAPELGASFYSDILNAALREVNWQEIAASMIEEVEKEEEESDDDTAARLEYLRAELRAERISLDELVELQALGERGLIPEHDVELREAAGLPEHDAQEGAE